MSAHFSHPSVLGSTQSTTSPDKRLLVTVNVTAFAIRDWSLCMLVREGPWGPPMRLVMRNESVTDAVERTLDALLLWSAHAPLVQLKAGWQEQQVSIWGSTEQGASVSLIHGVLLRANYDELRPHLHKHEIPSLRVSWVPVAEVELGKRLIDPDVFPGVQTALHTLRSQIQRNPEIVLRYLADMHEMCSNDTDSTEKCENQALHQSNESKEPMTGDGILTLAEAALLYRAFFPPDEQIDLSNLRRRFLATNTLELLDEERPVRGREMDWRRVSRAYKYMIAAS